MKELKSIDYIEIAGDTLILHWELRGIKFKTTVSEKFSSSFYSDILYLIRSGKTHKVSVDIVATASTIVYPGISMRTLHHNSFFKITFKGRNGTPLVHKFSTISVFNKPYSSVVNIMRSIITEYYAK